MKLSWASIFAIITKVKAALRFLSHFDITHPVGPTSIELLLVANPRYDITLVISPHPREEPKENGGGGD